ncbi:crotonase/enoyl-CoA hydratase family protein [Phytohabitans sp. ZYX-F-186]|uniref:Crotonase/enoyl-CoA hydratase family protein n=1 Tax=Phytohabitans maris TaxID=3071409 RepID=A0ABU0ZPY7_9ACTN|nr:crotonase/enoyl-CoA hydratase family protein [Phytohabitans sp. ZYX-F-186]MDQ7909070.1 crotonase/enoyl-CoA hydratase family protein [Phytohabitans sp. ZYX-F-186]
MTTAVLTEIRGRILFITLNRPDAMNAIDSTLGEGLLAAGRLLDSRDDLTVGVVSGAGRGFCAGMDLKAFTREGDPRGIEEFFQQGTKKPLIAAIEGFAVAGGLEIALTCDLLVAARGAKLGIPEVKVGLFAGGGGLLRLPRRLPYAMAMELALTGDLIPAERAYEHGLLARLAEPGGALAEATALAERIAANAPLGVRWSKHLIRQMQGRTELEFFEHQTPLLRAVLDSADGREGALAFAEKRTPQWTGR